MSIAELMPILNTAIARNFLVSVGIAVLIWAIRKIILRTIIHQMESDIARYQWQKTLNYVSAVLTIFIIAPLWSNGFSNMGTYLGLFSAGLAIALQPLIISLAGWFYIVGRRPFRVGNRIQIGDFAGDVLDIGPFQFIMMEIGNWVESDQSTGRIIHVPNKQIFTETLANYSDGIDFIWNEVTITITFESDWRKAKGLLMEIANKHTAMTQETARRKVREASKRFLIFYRNLTPTVYTAVVENGVTLTIRYLCEPRRRRSTSELLWEQVLDMVAANPDINLAYPTQRFYIAPEQQNSLPSPASGSANGSEKTEVKKSESMH